MLLYNPLDKFFKSTTGAISANKKTTFRVKFFDSVVFVYRKDGENAYNKIPMYRNGDCVECSLSFEKGLYFYAFELENGLFIGEGNNLYGIVTDNPKEYQLSVYEENYSVPKWLNGGIIYQIFPDRFFSSGENLDKVNGRIIHTDKKEVPIFLPNEQGKVVNNDFYGGDLKGIISKLEYIKSLGTTIIYLNPIFKSFSNHRYDTGDYMTVDPMLGNEEDLKELILKCNNLGIKIVLDGVFNHTGDDSLYFNKYGNYDSLGAYQSKDSPYYSWYNFINYPNKYESWWGIETLPAINEQNADYIDYITGDNGVLAHYTALGIGGWRLDVVDELPAHFVEKIRSAVKKVNDKAVVIGEVWEDASNKIAYGVRRKYFLGKELDSVMNYPLKDGIIDFVKNGRAENLANIINIQADHYPSFVLDSLMNLLSTHDTVRLLSAMGDYNYYGKSKQELSTVLYSDELLSNAKFRLKASSLLQYTLKGVPSLYYGDEIGMQGFIDPLNRRFFEWDNIDEEILSWYKKLGKIRSEYSAFKGEYEQLYAKGGVFVFKRSSFDSEILVGINVGDKEHKLKYEGVLHNLLDEENYADGYSLKGKSFAVLINQKV